MMLASRRKAGARICVGAGRWFATRAQRPRPRWDGSRWAAISWI